MKLDAFLELMLSLSLQAMIVLIVAWGHTKLARDARQACRVWSIGYGVLLTLVLLAVSVPHVRWMPRFDHQLGDAGMVELLSLQAQVSAVCFGVWAAGAFVVLLRSAVQSWRVARFVETCHSVPSEIMESLSGQDVRWEHRGQAVSLLSSRVLTGPFCWQFHRPFVVLPEFLLGLPAEELAFVVKHELAHLRTGHPLQVLWQRLVEVLFWFHPVVWWAGHEVSLAREYACDDEAISRPSQVPSYLRTLLFVVEHGAVEANDRSFALSFGRGARMISLRARRLAAIARNGWQHSGRACPAPAAYVIWTLVGLSCFCVRLPLNAGASARSAWSPWPSWSANLLHEVGVSVRDFEVFDERTVMQELLEDVTRRPAQPRESVLSLTAASQGR